jgi:hypothetical protein
MKVKNFAGFMKTRRMNESDGTEYSDKLGGMGMGDDEYADDESGFYGANPEDEEEEKEPEEGAEGEEEELTLEDLKAMIDDLTERVKKLEPEEEGEGEEGEEGEEPAEGEAAPEAASKV